ncbi:MAG: hypothetical protein ABJQ90_16370, partial [Parasphingorhabdus sp.]
EEYLSPETSPQVGVKLALKTLHPFNIHIAHCNRIASFGQLKVSGRNKLDPTLLQLILVARVNAVPTFIDRFVLL